LNWLGSIGWLWICDSHVLGYRIYQPYLTRAETLYSCAGIAEIGYRRIIVHWSSPWFQKEFTFSCKHSFLEEWMISLSQELLHAFFWCHDPRLVIRICCSFWLRALEEFSSSDSAYSPSSFLHLKIVASVKWLFWVIENLITSYLEVLLTHLSAPHGLHFILKINY
jgi:hypothetical protein